MSVQKNPHTQRVRPLLSSSPWSLASEFIAGFVCGLWIGYVLDQKYHTSPWGILGGSILGFIVGVWNVWKHLRKL